MLKPDWKETSQPIMCMYKLVTISVKWFGLQRKLEAIAHDIAKRSLVVMDRRMYCWMDEWIDLTYEEAKKIHQDLAAELKLVTIELYFYLYRKYSSKFPCQTKFFFTVSAIPYYGI
jgi:hypothetical protein